MDPVVISALIAGSCSLVSTFVGIMVSSKLSNYRIEQLEKKVDKHNNLVERMYKVEEENKLYDLELRTLKEKVSDLDKRYRDHD